MRQPSLATLRSRALALWHAYGRESPMPGLFLAVAEAPSGPIHDVYRPSLCIVLQGAKISRLGADAYRYGEGECLMTSLEVPIQAEIVSASVEVPFVALIIDIDPPQVADLLLQLARTDVTSAAIPGALNVQPLAQDLVDPLERLLALASRPFDIPVLAPMIQREIVWRLLNGPQGAMLRQIGLAESRTARISRAIAWLRGNFTVTISVTHLAALAGMSNATFHRHFKAATSMTPVQFQKQLRLQEARRLLMAQGADVAQVGFAIGYESPSQFSREYRRMFGAPPGRDSAEFRRMLATGGIG